jgi:hypothetical protein
VKSSANQARQTTDALDFPEPSLVDRGVAEAIRLLHNSPEAYPEVDSAPYASLSDPEHKVLAWCRAQTNAQSLRACVHQASHRLVFGICLLLILALIAGATTVRTALTTLPSPYANVYWAMLSLLGIQTLALFLWSIANLFLGIKQVSSLFIGTQDSNRSQDSTAHVTGSSARSSGFTSRGGWIGGWVLRIINSVTRRFSRVLHHKVAWQAWTRLVGTGTAGRWTLSGVTHAFWLMFHIGCLAMLLILLSTRQYVWVWETTILSDPNYRQWTQRLGFLPSKLGFPPPEPDDVSASRWTGTPKVLPSTLSESWSRFLIGCLLVYGVFPRAAFLGLSWILLQRAKSRYRLDLSQPFYRYLVTRLTPFTARLGLPPARRESGPEDSSGAVASGDTARVNRGPISGASPACLGLELGTVVPWPPQPNLSHPLPWIDLGQVESGQDQARVLQTLATLQPVPGALVILVDVTLTPDRGVERFLRQIQSGTPTPTWLVLTGQKALQSRGTTERSMKDRLQLWRTTAADAGLDQDQVVEIDLESQDISQWNDLIQAFGLSLDPS